MRVTIPRSRANQRPGAATVEFFRTPGRPGAAYGCPYVSPYFRTVEWEQDSVAGAVLFLSYDTGAARPEDWLGGFGVPAGAGREDLLRLVARVPRTTVVAAPVVLDFR